MKKMLVMIVALLLIASSAFAASPWNREGISKGQKMKEKAIYGLTNLGLGWTEILQEPGEAIANKQCFLCGLGTGLGNAMGDTIGGAAHLLTFWCPKTDIALPEGGTDIVAPTLSK